MQNSISLLPIHLQNSEITQQNWKSIQKKVPGKFIWIATQVIVF